MELRTMTLKRKITMVAAISAAPTTMIGDWLHSRMPEITATTPAVTYARRTSRNALTMSLFCYLLYLRFLSYRTNMRQV